MGSITLGSHRPVVGDVLELPTRNGLRYAQYTHHDPEFGALLRVIDRAYSERPNDLNKVVREPAAFVTFFPLAAAVRRGILSVVGSAPVPEGARRFPLFKAAGSRDPSTGAVLDWWLWDGTREWRIGALPPEQRSLPPREVINDTLLISRLERGWRPELDRDVTGVAPDEAVEQPFGDPNRRSRHFLAFPSEISAGEAADILRDEGMEVDQRDSDLRVSVPDADIPTARERLERSAERCGGSYDGWEARPTHEAGTEGRRRGD